MLYTLYSFNNILHEYNNHKKTIFYICIAKNIVLNECKKNIISQSTESL